MRTLLSLALFSASAATAADLPKFKVQEIDAGLKIGYAVVTADVDGDKKPDIVVVDQHKVVWYRNPGKADGEWKKFVMLDGKTKPDNVCIAPIDIDGDGKPEFVLGAAWKPFDTANPGQLVWLKRGDDVTKEWSMHELPCDEPTVHRVRCFDIDGDGKPEIVHVPLMGRGSSAKGLWVDGKPVRIVALKVPAKEPEKKENWKTQVLSEELNVCHNFLPAGLGAHGAKSGSYLTVGSFEGLSTIAKNKEGKFEAFKLFEGNQANPKGNRGCSELAWGEYESYRIVADEYRGGTYDPYAFAATIEPWHGNQVVVHEPPVEGNKLWKRTVIDEQLRWGHAVKCAQLGPQPTGTAFGAIWSDIIVGVRDDPNPKMGDNFKERRGVRIYRKNKDGKWERTILEDGGVAVEDLTVADLNGDDKPDIVAVGRATGNCRIYWNQGK